MSETASKIAETIEKISKLETARKHHEDLGLSIEKMEEELNALFIAEAKELTDVEQLEKLSLTSLFQKAIGTREQQLDKERQEYLAVALKIKELKKTIELSQFELEVVSKKLSEFEQLSKQLEELKQIRKSEILAGTGDHKDQLIGLHRSIDEALKKKNEIVEAHDKGREALNSVETVFGYLSEAIRNSEWDMFSKGGYHDYKKHRALDHAAEEAYKSQILLSQFNKELMDVGIYEQSLRVNLSQISNFTDTFFDNLITDWIVHNKIKNSINVVVSIKDKIRVILDTLESEFKEINQTIERIKTSVDDLVTKVKS